MKELVYVLAVVVIVAALLTVIARRFEPVLRWVENTLTYLSTAVILFVMAFVCAEVTMRYGFNSPIPGHLEGSELLMPIIVFFAVSYTQARNGHVGMTVVVDALPPHIARWLSAGTLVLSLLICAVLAWFGTKYAYQLWDYDDVTMTPPYWRTWPSAAVMPLGYTLLAMRMWLQTLNVLAPERFPGMSVEDTGLHTVE